MAAHGPGPLESAGGPMRPAERIAEREQFARQFQVHVGVDAGKSFHKMVASGPDRVRTKAVRVDVTREGFASALTFLRTQFPDAKPEETLVAIEFAGHYGYTFADFLRARGFVIVTMPSIVTKRLKEIEDNSPRKDDAKDAAQICKLVGAGLFVSYTRSWISRGQSSRHTSRISGQRRRARSCGGGPSQPMWPRRIRARCTP
jgi:transposase